MKTNLSTVRFFLHVNFECSLIHDVITQQVSKNVQTDEAGVVESSATSEEDTFSTSHEGITNICFL